MTRKSVFFLTVAAILVFSGCMEKEVKGEDLVAVAENWIRESAPTFTDRNGTDLKHLETIEVEKDGVHGLKFVFEASFGYGLSGYRVVTDFKTERTIVVTIENGTVTEAITDQRYDEINNEFSLVIEPTQEELLILIGRVNRLAEESLSEEEFNEKLKEEAVMADFLQNSPIHVTEKEIEEFINELEYYEDKADFIQYWTEERGFPKDQIIQEIIWDIKRRKLMARLQQETNVPSEIIEEGYEAHTEWAEGQGINPISYHEFAERVEKTIIFDDIIEWEIKKIQSEAVVIIE